MSKSTKAYESSDHNDGNEPEARWLAYYAEHARRRRARGIYRHRHEQKLSNPRAQWRLLVILGVVGIGAAIVAMFLP